MCFKFQDYHLLRKSTIDSRGTDHCKISVTVINTPLLQVILFSSTSSHLYDGSSTYKQSRHNSQPVAAGICKVNRIQIFSIVSRVVSSFWRIGILKCRRWPSGFVDKPVLQTGVFAADMRQPKTHFRPFEQQWWLITSFQQIHIIYEATSLFPRFYHTLKIIGPDGVWIKTKNKQKSKLCRIIRFIALLPHIVYKCVPKRLHLPPNSWKV